MASSPVTGTNGVDTPPQTPSSPENFMTTTGSFVHSCGGGCSFLFESLPHKPSTSPVCGVGAFKWLASFAKLGPRRNLASAPDQGQGQSQSCLHPTLLCIDGRFSLLCRNLSLLCTDFTSDEAQFERLMSSPMGQELLKKQVEQTTALERKKIEEERLQLEEDKKKLAEEKAKNEEENKSKKSKKGATVRCYPHCRCRLAFSSWLRRLVHSPPFTPP